MDIRCQRCDANIPAGDVNIRTSIAKCNACDAVFNIEGQVGTDRDERRPLVAMPKGMKVHVDDAAWNRMEEDPYRGIVLRSTGATKVEWRWFRPMVFFLLFFAIAWNSFLIFWYSQALSSGSWLMTLFPIAHVAVGVGLTYHVACVFLNTTTMTLKDHELVIRVSPLPSFSTRNRRIPAKSIEQLFVKEHKHQSSSTHGSRSTSYTYSLYALIDGKELKLVKLDEEGQALFLEQLFEQQLGIKDRAVGGAHT